MLWEDRRRNTNVEDRRGMRVSHGIIEGGMGGVVILLIAPLFGVSCNGNRR